MNGLVGRLATRQPQAALPGRLITEALNGQWIVPIGLSLLKRAYQIIARAFKICGMPGM